MKKIIRRVAAVHKKNKHKFILPFHLTYIFAIGFILLFLIILFGNFFRDLISNFLQQKMVARVEQVEKEINPTGMNLVFSSFTDLFSGTGWFDENRTTMYRDNVAMAFTFQPLYTWEKVAEEVPQNFGEINNQKCIGGVCLLVTGGRLTMNGETVSLPKEIAGKNTTISLDILGEVWGVGGVVHEGSEYLGYLYTFDGKKFSPVCTNEAQFRSQYTGVIGMGGTTHDFIAVFGAYEGKGVRVVSGVCEDISSFFDIRSMAGGFRPHIFRVENSGNISWYVSSNQDDYFRLSKLFGEIGTNTITGVVNLSDFIVAGDAKKTSFVAVERVNGFPSLRGVIEKRDGTREVWRYIDKGFETPQKTVVYSKNINTNEKSAIAKVTLVEMKLNPGSTDAKISISNNGKNWQAIKQDETVVFSNEENSLFWRAEFTKSNKGNVPPFFSQIRFDYRMRLLP